MWNLVRTLIIALAFAGFLGQSMARATPLPVAAEAVEMSADCAEMEMDQADPSDGKRMPCDEMTPECMVQMGSTAVSPVLRHEPMLSHPLAGATGDGPVSPSRSSKTPALTLSSRAGAPSWTQAHSSS